jgi:beta propeller repeat protein
MIGKALRLTIVSLCGITTSLSTQVTLGEVFPVMPGQGAQEHPAVSGSWVVWQQYNPTRGDYDVVLADANNIADPLVLTIDDPNDQMHPALWESTVVWQEYSIRRQSEDWDIFMVDAMGDEQGVAYVYPVSQEEGIDEQWPAIHGNTVVWEDAFPEWSNIYGADVAFPADIRVFPVAAFDGNQVAPVVWRDQVLWQDDFYGDWDIYVSDVWLINRVTEGPLAFMEYDQMQVAVGDGIAVWQDNTFGDWDIVGADISSIYGGRFFDDMGRDADQMNPAVSGGIVVYQDNRSGNWDIYARNLFTGMEQRLTKHKTDQINPAISGNWVVWQDARDGDWQVYSLWMDGSLRVGIPQGCVE